MANYMKERQAIANPFQCNQTFPKRPSPFPNLQKAAPKRKRTAKATPRKIRKIYVPNKRSIFLMPKEEQMKNTFTMAIPVTTTPATVAAVTNSPTTLPASKERRVFYQTCSALGRPCPLFALPASTVTPPHSDWSDVEEDWDGERQKEEEKKRNREHEEKELEQKPITDLPSPQYTPSFKGDTAALIDTLVPAPAWEEDQEDKEVEQEKPTEEDDKDTEWDYDSDDTVTI